MINTTSNTTIPWKQDKQGFGKECINGKKIKIEKVTYTNYIYKLQTKLKCRKYYSPQNVITTNLKIIIKK